MSQDRQRCFDAGCNEYLSKPIDRQDLLDAIAEFPTSSAPPSTASTGTTAS